MSPLEAIASAAALILSSVTDDAKQFQLFHPNGGVSAIVSPQTILNFFSAEPTEFFARSITADSPRFETAPVITPVLESMLSHFGKPYVENVIGRVPVAD